MSKIGEVSTPSHLSKSDWEIIQMSFEISIPRNLPKLYPQLSSNAILVAGVVRGLTHGGGWLRITNEAMAELSFIDIQSIKDGLIELSRENVTYQREVDCYEKEIDYRCIRLRGIR
jgi:hypothetical protein